MFGMRCRQCDEVRWSVLGRSQAQEQECPVCGGEMVEERRRPGRHVRKAIERRDRTTTPGVAPRVKLG